MTVAAHLANIIDRKARLILVVFVALCERCPFLTFSLARTYKTTKMANLLSQRGERQSTKRKVITF